MKELYTKLQEAYTIDNLNSISLTLINFYKNREYSILQNIAEMLSDTVDIKISDRGKGFSKFMMLYHPDRQSLHMNEINRLAAENNYEGLLSYSHILQLNRIEEIAQSLNNYEDIDYSPVYEWDFTMDGFTIINNNEETQEFSEELNGCNFYDAIKKRMFENPDTEYPSHYLADLDEIELSGSEISDLEGVEYCVHAIRLDLSDNLINDLSPLFSLSLLEELDLSFNKLEDLEPVSNLVSLKYLNLSNNNIRDISPLLYLNNLEFADLTGNHIEDYQLKELIESGVNVEY